MANGFKVRCADIGDFGDCLTLGMTYEVLEEKYYLYEIKCDSGEEYFFPKYLFEIVDHKKQIENKMKLIDILKVVTTSQAIRIGYPHTGEVFYPAYSELKNLEEYEVLDIESKSDFLEITIKPTEI
ncbi:hypothetical protein [Clostridium sp. UBA4395]|uniref:hypothetical protein n=1 Tax=Clostridium sp. UBA4395 TaxID=1946360 RepID=UPI0032162F38